MGKRVLFLLALFPLVAFTLLVWWPIEYLRTGKIDAENTPVDRMHRWAK